MICKAQLVADYNRGRQCGHLARASGYCGTHEKLLIHAAASDLLEAAKLAVHLHTSGAYLGDDALGVWTALRKAIAKAEGKTDG